MLSDTFVKRIPAWRSWIIGNAIGESIGRLCGFIVSLLEIAILYYVPSLADPHVGRFLTKTIVLCITSVAIGGVVGLAQYQVLKKLVSTGGQWILACVAGLMIGRLLTFFLFQNLTTLIQPVFVGFLQACCNGFC